MGEVGNLDKGTKDCRLGLIKTKEKTKSFQGEKKLKG